MANELTELEMSLSWYERDKNPNLKKIAKVGMDVLLSDRSSSYWGVITKITDGWGGTIFVTSNVTCYKFDKSGSLRTQDAWNHISMTVHTPEEKIAIKAAKAEEKQRIRKAIALKEIRWDMQGKDFIQSVYDLAIKNEVITPPVPEK